MGLLLPRHATITNQHSKYRRNKAIKGNLGINTLSIILIISGIIIAHHPPTPQRVTRFSFIYNGDEGIISLNIRSTHEGPSLQRGL